MNYRIVYLLNGEVKEYAENLIKGVAKKFNVDFVYSRKQPAHITFKYGFETEKVGLVEDVLSNLSKGYVSSDFEIKGFGNFGRDVLFLKVRPSKEMISFQKELVKELKILGIDLNEYDEGLSKNFHICIAMEDIGNKFNEIKKYIEEFDKSFKVKFDKISLVKKPKNKWIVHKEYKLK